MILRNWGEILIITHAKQIKLIKTKMEELTFYVNCAEGEVTINGQKMANFQGGKLLITDTQFIFNPHMLNFGSQSPKFYNIKDITGH